MPVDVGSPTATRSKILGQLEAAASTSEDVYTVPADTTAEVTAIAICNTTSGALTYRLSFSVAGAVLATKQYVAKDQSVAANSTVWITGVTINLGAADKIRFYGSASGFTINVFGHEAPIQPFT